MALVLFYSHFITCAVVKVGLSGTITKNRLETCELNIMFFVANLYGTHVTMTTCTKHIAHNIYNIQQNQYIYIV